nr:MAG TPA: hypothetical protein [Caudoviricetes sp.]
MEGLWNEMMRKTGTRYPSDVYRCALRGGRGDR